MMQSTRSLVGFGSAFPLTRNGTLDPDGISGPYRSGEPDIIDAQNGADRTINKLVGKPYRVT